MKRSVSILLAILLMLGLNGPALAATVGESGGVPGGADIVYTPGAAPEGRTARMALFSAGTETEAITLRVNNNDPDRITGFTVSAVPADGGEPLYGVRQGESWSYKLPFSSPPQEDTDFTISVTSQGNRPGFYQSAVKETVMTYNAIKSLTIQNGDADATGKTLYLQTNNAEGKQSVQLAATKNGSSGSAGSTGHPYMKANDYAEPVVWQSSNESVATVDDTGLVTAHTGGTATVTASVYSGKVTASCTINVSAVTGVSLSHTAYSLFTGGTAAETQFTLSAALTGGLASDELEWTNSNPSAAALTVAADGRSAVISASGKTAGSTTIAVHVKGAPDTAQYKANCTVTAVTIGSVTVSPNAYTIYTLGEPKTVQLAATVNPNAAPLWQSSSSAAATVNQTGLVTAVAPGSTTITATVGGKSGSSVITVKDKIAVTSVTVSGTNSLVRTSDKTTVTTQLSAAVKPDSAHFKTVSWAKTGGSGSINISAGGLVTATAAGSATFTATADGVTSAAYTVTVSDQAPTGITISSSTATVLVDNTVTINATVAPSNAINRNVSWTSSNAAVATVSPASSGSGVNVTVKGIAAGTAVITAKAAGNTGKSVTCTVTVKPKRPVDDSGNMIDSASLGKKVNWAGRSWWVIDSDGTPYGGNDGSVVLLMAADYFNGSFGTSGVYATSTARTHCQTFYNSLSSAQKEKLASHKALAEGGITDKAWVISAYEVYGSSRNSWAKDTYREIRQFEYFSKKNTTITNYTAVKEVFGRYQWLRSPSTYPRAGEAHIQPQGILGDTGAGPSYSCGITPAVILNP